MLERWGSFVARRALSVVVLGVVALLAAGAYGAGVFDSLSQGGFDDPASESSIERDAEQELFGNRSADVVAVYSSDELRVTDPAFRSAVLDAVGRIPDGTTSSVTTYYDTGARDLVSRDGDTTRVVISLAGDSQDEVLSSWERVEPALEAEDLRTDLAGSFAVYGDVNEISEHDLRRAETLSLPIVLLLSLLIFGSLVAAGMPVLVGVFSVLGGLAVVRLIAEVTEVSVFSINVITLIGLGLAVDYALFVISRFREELGRRDPDDPDAVADAVRTTMVTAGRTVLFSGLTVAAALASLLVFPQSFLRSMGYGGMAAVLVAMVTALTVLPATLRLLGRRIDAGRVRLPGRRSTNKHAAGEHVAEHIAEEHGAWARLARSVMRRPGTYLVVVTGALLLVASPFLGVKWGSVDYRVLPEDAPSRVAAERLAQEFGAEQSTANVLLRGADQATVRDVAAQVEAVEGVEAVAVVAQDDGAALLQASWTGNSQTEASQAVVERIRDVEPAEGSMLVGGLAASTVDLLDSVGAHLPWMGLIVVAVMLVLLFLAFGSVVLPLKAVLVNVLSITASFGVVTWIFSDGHLESVLGFESQGFLDATQPILMLAILFGLSMDYEVFLLSRVREEWDRSHDNTRSVAVGLQKTGRIITSAALLLAVVIGAFGTSGIVFMKLIGIGMLVALLVDATVVRALLVPATMKLLGRANWWAPGPLRRWWERYGFREEPPVVREPERLPEPV
ncbi:MMPL family transporter [Nocardioides caldifontis]|uniref:MMPL family transporter n=1 Tax=Nocardioides caldifontis TaxID=2588938 RepID=UPI0011DF9A60|nr:MMPL family transporter [Nocardioides caldifontis]